MFLGSRHSDATTQKTILCLFFVNRLGKRAAGQVSITVLRGFRTCPFFARRTHSLPHVPELLRVADAVTVVYFWAFVLRRTPEGIGPSRSVPHVFGDNYLELV